MKEFHESEADDSIDWQAVKAALESRGAERSASELSMALEAVHARIGSGDERSRGLGRSLRGWVGYAAAAVMVVAYFLPKFTDLNQDRPVNQEFKEYTTAPGQRATVALKDGTKVLLNVASRIRVANDYGKGSRTIDLTGEAQFTVTHDPKLPFVIRANGTLVRDLATTFAVRAYPGTAVTRVAVREGRVAVQAPAVSSANAVAVDAGNAAVVADGKTLVSDIGSGDNYFAWTEGKLILDDVPLHKALVELSRWYNLEFQVSNNAMLARKVTGTFPQSFSTDRVQAIADIVNARIERAGTAVIFHSQENNAKPRSSE